MNYMLDSLVCIVPPSIKVEGRVQLSVKYLLAEFWYTTWNTRPVYSTYKSS